MTTSKLTQGRDTIRSVLHQANGKDLTQEQVNQFGSALADVIEVMPASLSEIKSMKPHLDAWLADGSGDYRKAKAVSEAVFTAIRPMGDKRQIDPTDENPRRGVDSDGGGPGTIKAIKSTDKFAETNGGASSVSLDGYLRAALTGDWDRLPADLFYGSNMKAMATDALGSLTLPSTLTNRVIDLARSKSRVIQAGAITARMNGPKETISRVTGSPNPAWKTENALIAAGDLVFEPVNLVARTLAARAIMSVELSDDVPTIGDALEAELTAAMAGELDRAALLGSGTPPEPRGLLNTSGVTVQDVSLGLAGGYADFSRAVQHIREAEGEPNAVILGPDVLGELERLTDMDGNPLVPPDSYKELRKLTTTRLAEKAVVGDWSKFLVAIRQELRIEATRQANDENGLGFSSYSVLIRATLRADFAVLRPSHFEVLTTFATGS